MKEDGGELVDTPSNRYFHTRKTQEWLKETKEGIGLGQGIYFQYVIGKDWLLVMGNGGSKATLYTPHSKDLSMLKRYREERKYALTSTYRNKTFTLKPFNEIQEELGLICEDDLIQ